MTVVTQGSYPPPTSGGGGAQWFEYAGSGTPAGISGANNGDRCLRSDGEVFKLVTGVWTDTTINIKGAAGATGSAGANGSNGTPGDTAQGVPALNGLLLQTFDVQSADVTTVTTTSGRAYLTKVYAPNALTITNLVGLFSAAGSALSYCRMAIFDHSGNLLSITADLSTSWATSGNANVVQVCPVQPTAAGSPTPYSWAGGSGASAYFYIGYLATGTTTPSVFFKGTMNTNLTNVNTSLASSNFVAAFQNLSNLNGPVTWTSGALTSVPPWTGVS